jgi:hypothetical protein
MSTRLNFSLALCLSVMACAQDALPQQPSGDRGGNRPQSQWRDLHRVMGTVISVSGNQIVVKPESGENVTAVVDSDARIRKDRQEAKLSDFKAGDHILVAGTEGADKVLHAKLVAGGQMGQGQGGMRGGMMGAISPEEMVKAGLGTKFIAGEVKAINETKLTVLRPDGQTQTIEVDENTSFRDSKGDSVTLADMKVGDRVMGRGDVKNGVFIPETLRFGTPQGPGGMMRRYPGGPPASAPGGPVSTAPGPAQQQQDQQQPK